MGGGCAPWDAVSPKTPPQREQLTKAADSSTPVPSGPGVKVMLLAVPGSPDNPHRVDESHAGAG